MPDLINGRTAEEIKLNLKTCGESSCLMECPYYNYPIESCAEGLARDALALIAQLEAERDAALAKVPKWISVEERKPPEDTDVLVYATEKIEGFGDAIALCEYGETTSMFGNKTGRYDWSTPWPYFHVDYKITHWMPLPEPPEEQRDAKGE